MRAHRTAIAMLGGACLVATVVGIALIGWARTSAATNAPVFATPPPYHGTIPPTPMIPPTVLLDPRCVGPANVPPTPVIVPAPTPASYAGCVPTANPTAIAQSNVNSGVPAITPRSSTADPKTPAFTAQDAAQYVTSHRVDSRVDAIGSVSIVSVDFLTVQDAQTRLGGATLYPLLSDQLVCLVKASGTFSVSGSPVSTTPTAPRTANTEYVIFDAHTGNLMAVNVRNI